MKKSYNPISDGNNEKNELTRRIYSIHHLQKNHVVEKHMLLIRSDFRGNPEVKVSCIFAHWSLEERITPLCFNLWNNKCYNLKLTSKGLLNIFYCILRSLSEVVRQLDDVRGRSKTISDLFLPCLATLRIKLHDLCYKLILTDPLGYGKKGEELLWKKGYHDVFTTAKRLKKNDKWSPQEASFVQALLVSGMGHYQHLLFKLQSDYKVNIQGLIDFPISISDLGLLKVKPTPQKPPDKCLEDWAKDSCHRCLIYLGDLNRYFLDIFPLWDSGTAERYYMQATNMNVNCGRPFNQLGTLAGIKNYNLDAVYYYIRCLIRPESFEGAEANVRKALDKNFELIQLNPLMSNPAPAIQKFVTKFLLLFDILYFERSVEYNIHDLNQEMMQEFEFCLEEKGEKSYQLDVNELELSNLTPFQGQICIHPCSLNTDMILKIIILSLICIEKLQKRDSPDTSVAIALCLDIFSQLLQKIVKRFQKFYADFGLVEKCVVHNQKMEDLKNDSQADASSTEKCEKKNKVEEVICYSRANGLLQPEKKCMKYSGKKKNKNNHTRNSADGIELSELKITDSENAKDKVKKKSKLKRRKRVRPDSLCDSELSDSDITLNDSTSEEDFSSGESESDEVISSDSEGLDETLLIIDQKIKEKKYKEDKKKCEINGIIKNVILSVDSKEKMNGIPKNNSTVPDSHDREIMPYNLMDHNGLRGLNEKDKTKSLFTILNGVEKHAKLNENSGDYALEDKSLCDSLNKDGVQLSQLTGSENNEHGDFSVNEKANVNTAQYDERKLDMKELLHFLSEQDILRVIKVFCDWMTCNTEVLKICSKNSKHLLSEIVTFLNLLKCERELPQKDLRRKNIDLNIPLSEDIITRGLSMLQVSQEKLDWNFHKSNILTNREETLLRVLKFIEFGHFLVKQEETGILFNKEGNIFYTAGQNGTTTSLDAIGEKEMNNSTNRKGQLMKNMGQLWLKAEVRDLESRVRKKAGNFSPYLVIDTEALIEHIVLVKQLVGSRQFLVIIPTVVLSHLDECKRDSGRARETIRWLESQFQHGNRSLRAQKSQERFSLPLIKYPKKKDKEAWNFFQIVECCHYFSKQSEFQSCHSNLLVTLLTGHRDLAFASDNRKDDFGKEYSPIGVAKNFGINLEHIEAFHTKWKLSTKSHG